MNKHADVATLEHTAAMFRLPSGGVIGDRDITLARFMPCAILPAPSHTAVISQPELLLIRLN